MFCELFTMVGAAGLELYKIDRKIIDDIFNNYSLRCQVKVKSTFSQMK